MYLREIWDVPSDRVLGWSNVPRFQFSRANLCPYKRNIPVYYMAQATSDEIACSDWQTCRSVIFRARPVHWSIVYLEDWLPIEKWSQKWRAWKPFWTLVSGLYAAVLDISLSPFAAIMAYCFVLLRKPNTATKTPEFLFSHRIWNKISALSGVR